MKRQLNPMARFAAMTMLLVATAASADKIDIAGGIYQNSNGGEFKITTLSGPTSPGITGLAHDLSSNTFQTFCLEHQENISLGGDYYFQVATSATQGGGSAGGATLINPYRDPLRYATQWLYVNFRNDTLAGYDDNNTSAVASQKRVNDARQLQLAFWFLENEIRANSTGAALTDYYAYLGGTTPAQQANTTQAELWVAAALAAEAGPQSTSIAASVQVLRLWTNSNFTGYAQDQLTMVAPASALSAVPLPGIAMAGSLCFGLLGLGVRRFKRAS